MGRSNKPILTDEVRKILERNYRENKNHSFRRRCQLILLKSEGRNSDEVAGILKICSMSVNNWVSKFNSAGLEGLRTKPGRGRKSIINKEKDSDLILEIVKNNRQRLSVAKEEFEKASGKKMSNITLQRFLKVLVEDTNG